MDSMDLEVLKACRRWLAAGRRCELITVSKTWGSSPRPQGAMLALCDDGSVAGSVSGGCIEDDLIAQIRAEGMQRVLPDMLRYGISADEAHRFGLPCGGTIELVREPLSAHSGIDDLLQLLERQQLVARTLRLSTGAVTLTAGQTGPVVTVIGDTVVTLHGPRWRLLLIGAGQLSAFLAQIAMGMDYQVTVCDPREEFRDQWQVSQVQIIHAMPDDLVIEMRLDACSAVVALTHDPKLDDLALMEALRSPAFYVGAIGSRENNARRRERLQLFDLDQTSISRLHGPVGLPIGSKTPPEIAISIIAEMTAIRNGVGRSETERLLPPAKNGSTFVSNATGACSGI